MNVLITGAAGYIGSVILRRLRLAGHHVTALDNLTYGSAGIDGIPHLATWYTDIRNISRTHLAGIQAIVHLAGISNDPTADLDDNLTYDVNLYATNKLARLAAEVGVERFLYASSASIYDTGECTEQPPVVAEDCPIAPLGAYSISKYRAEGRVRAAGATSGMKVAILRQGTVYGYSPRLRMDLVVQTMVRSALAHRHINLHSGGQNWRPIVSITNLADVYADLLAQLNPPAEATYNIVDENVQIAQIAEAVRAEVARRRIVATVHEIPTPKGQRIRNYRISRDRYGQAHGLLPLRLHDEVRRLCDRLADWTPEELYAPVHENLAWLRRAEAQRAGASTGVA